MHETYICYLVVLTAAHTMPIKLAMFLIKSALLVCGGADKPV